MRTIKRGPKRVLHPARLVPDVALTDPQPPRLSANRVVTESLPELAIPQRRFAGNNMAEARANFYAVRRNGFQVPMRYMNIGFSLG